MYVSPRLIKTPYISKLLPAGTVELEIWGVEAEKKAFEKIFGKDLVLERVQTV